MIPDWNKVMAEHVRVVESYGAAQPFAIEIHIQDKKFKVAQYASLEEAHQASIELKDLLKELFGKAYTS